MFDFFGPNFCAGKSNIRSTNICSVDNSGDKLGITWSILPALIHRFSTGFPQLFPHEPLWQTCDRLRRCPAPVRCRPVWSASDWSGLVRCRPVRCPAPDLRRSGVVLSGLVWSDVDCIGLRADVDCIGLRAGPVSSCLVCAPVWSALVWSGPVSSCLSVLSGPVSGVLRQSDLLRCPVQSGPMSCADVVLSALVRSGPVSCLLWTASDCTALVWSGLYRSGLLWSGPVSCSGVRCPALVWSGPMSQSSPVRCPALVWSGPVSCRAVCAPDCTASDWSGLR